MAQGPSDLDFGGNLDHDPGLETKMSWRRCILSVVGGRYVTTDSMV